MKDRIETLKGYLKRLGNGEPLEAVRKDFVEVFKDVDPAEIMKAEQEMLAEGTPLLEVQKLCDVHAALFHGKTREEQIANAERAVNASVLREERETRTRELAQINLDSARDKLMDILCNYQGYQGCRLILVYDAYKVKGNPGSVMKYHNIEVVYTKEAETADQYIERTTHELGAKPQKYRVTVATSDALEQMIIWGNGATRMSALGLKAAVEAAGAEYFE